MRMDMNLKNPLITLLEVLDAEFQVNEMINYLQNSNMPQHQKMRLIMEAIFYISVEYRETPGNHNKSFEGIIEFLGPEDEEDDYNKEDEFQLIHPINTSCESPLRHEFQLKTRPARLRQLVDGYDQTYFLEDNLNFELIT